MSISSGQPGACTVSESFLRYGRIIISFKPQTRFASCPSYCSALSQEWNSLSAVTRFRESVSQHVLVRIVVVIIWLDATTPPSNDTLLHHHRRTLQPPWTNRGDLCGVMAAMNVDTNLQRTDIRPGNTEIIIIAGGDYSRPPSNIGSGKFAYNSLSLLEQVPWHLLPWAAPGSHVVHGSCRGNSWPKSNYSRLCGTHCRNYALFAGGGT